MTVITGDICSKNHVHMNDDVYTSNLATLQSPRFTPHASARYFDGTGPENSNVSAREKDILLFGEK